MRKLKTKPKSETGTRTGSRTRIKTNWLPRPTEEQKDNIESRQRLVEWNFKDPGLAIGGKDQGIFFKGFLTIWEWKDDPRTILLK